MYIPIEQLGPQALREPFHRMFRSYFQDRKQMNLTTSVYQIHRVTAVSVHSCHSTESCCAGDVNDPAVFASLQ